MIHVCSEHLHSSFSFFSVSFFIYFHLTQFCRVLSNLADAEFLSPDGRYGFHVRSKRLCCRLRCRLTSGTGHPAGQLNIGNVVLSLPIRNIYWHSGGICVLIKIEASFPSRAS